MASPSRFMFLASEMIKLDNMESMFSCVVHHEILILQEVNILFLV